VREMTASHMRQCSLLQRPVEGSATGSVFVMSLDISLKAGGSAPLNSSVRRHRRIP
jgi:hypothetical protein